MINRRKANHFSQKKQKTRRLNWAKEHINWTNEEWNNVIFSDESRFELCVGNQRGRVIRNKSEAFEPNCLKRTVKFPKSVMIWGCISSKGVGNFVFVSDRLNADKYQGILRNDLVPSIKAIGHGRKTIFQQDGATCHTATSTMRWFSNNRIKVLTWPSGSPDLSPIENIWSIMKKSLRKKLPNTESELKLIIQEEWNSITTNQCQMLINTMRNRLDSVIKARGDVTKY